MFHFKSVTAQLNEANDRQKKVNDQTASYDTWSRYQSSLSSWILDIEPDFIRDNFNIYGLKCNTNIKEVVSLILDKPENAEKYSQEVRDESFPVFVQIHQRYATTSQGLQSVQRKYDSGCFGHCPRYECGGQHLLPMGFSYKPGESHVCGWCPKCNDSYEVDCQIDSAFYGPSFPHFFMRMTKDVSKIKPAPKEKLTYLGIPIES